MKNLPAEIFKAYDIRGIVDKTLTVSLVEKIGKAIGTLVLESGENTLIIGRDGRLSGPKFSQSLAKGALSTGCNVIDIGQVPTGVLYYATHKLASRSGVVITGSHNPPDYNGLKIVINGESLSGEKIQALKTRIEKKSYRKGTGVLIRRDIIAMYISDVCMRVSLKRRLKVVIDCGNGIAGAVAPELFRALGCDVIELFCEVDGNFPNHHPDPSQPKNLVDLIKHVNINQADLGLGFDGDGDRVGTISPKGDIIWPDRQMILFSQELLIRKPGSTIIYDVKCSQLLAKAITEAGGNAIMWKTGHSLIKNKMKLTGAELAGEMSGHIFFKDRWYGFDDGLYVGARLCELMSRQENIQQTFDRLPNSINTPELQIKLNKDGEQHKLIKKLLDCADFPDGKVTDIDGLRVDYDYGFGLTRASNTTPTIVIRFEAKNQYSMKKIQTEFRALFKKVVPQLPLPF